MPMLSNARVDHEDARTRPRQRLAFILGTIAYTGLLQLAYVEVISPVWEYLGYTYISPAPTLWIASFVLAIAPALWIPVRLTRPSQWLYLYLYLSLYIPLCFVPLFRGAFEGVTRNRPEYLLGMALVCFAALGLIYRFPLMSIRFHSVSPTDFWLLVGTILVAAYVLVFWSFGGSMQLVMGSESVREQRFLGRDIIGASAFPLLVGYSLNLAGHSVNPFLMAYGLWTRRTLIFAAGLAGQVFLYSTTAARGYLATIPMVILLLTVLGQKRWSVSVFSVWLFVALILMVTVSPLVCSGDAQLEISWAAYRTFFSPALLTEVYYDLFSESPQTGFSHIRGLGWLADNPYPDRSIGQVVGDSMGSSESNANANLWADGFASLGFTGMFIATAFAAFVFHLADSASEHVDVGMATAALSCHALSLIDLPIFTAFLGGGLGLSIVLTCLAPRPVKRANSTGAAEVVRSTVAGAPRTDPRGDCVAW